MWEKILNFWFRVQGLGKGGGMRGVRGGPEGHVGSDRPFRGHLRTSHYVFFLILNSVSS
jgi:hypothetical protein